MNRVKLARAIAARSAPRFIEIEPDKPIRRFTAHDNMQAKWAAETNAKQSALLEAEQRRLIQTWEA